MSCYYSCEELSKWDGVSNPIGEHCHKCENYDCEHNPNPNPEDIQDQILMERYYGVD